MWRRSNQYFFISQINFWKYNYSTQIAQEKGIFKEGILKPQNIKTGEKSKYDRAATLQYERRQNKYKLKYNWWHVAHIRKNNTR